MGVEVPQEPTEATDQVRTDLSQNLPGVTRSGWYTEVEEFETGDRGSTDPGTLVTVDT